MPANPATCVAYYRTSSHTNVGGDKDSHKRQQEAVHAYAAAQGLEIVREFYDAAVSGADPINERPGFLDLLAYMHGNGAKTILVENASRFARDLAVQLTGHDLLKAQGFTLIAVDSPDSFTDDTPTAVMVRQILGSVSQFQKTELVLKLKAARDRKRRAGGYAGGYKPVPPEVVKLAKRLHKLDPETGKIRTLQAIAHGLAQAGYMAPSGKPYLAGSVAKMLTKG